jgi:hypothetical protein
MNQKKYAWVRFQISDEEKNLLMTRAKNENKSVRGLMKSIFFDDLRETQRASAMENHILDFERRLVNTMKHLTKEMGRLNSTGQVTLSAIDIFLRTYLTHTPPIQEAEREFARQEAKRRYDGIITAIHGGLSDDFGLTEVARKSMPEEKSHEQN